MYMYMHIFILALENVMHNKSSLEHMLGVLHLHYVSLRDLP